MTEPVGPATHGLARGLTNNGDPDFALYLRRSFARSMGYCLEMLSRPVIGIADTRSGFNNCHRHFPELIAAVKRGVLASGGLPLVFPTISLGEVFLSPTSLMFRNLMAMDTEEMIRAQPMDAVVLVGGCDKTRSEEHTSELQSRFGSSYAVFCLKKKKTPQQTPCYAYAAPHVDRASDIARR